MTPGGTDARQERTVGKPRATVIVPIFEPALFLDRALASVLAQSMRSLELIALSDGQQPGAEASVVALADPRVVHLHDPALLRMKDREERLTYARQLGLEKGRGDYVAVLNGGDGWHPRFLERAVAELDAHRGAAYAYTRVDHVDMDDRRLRPPLGIAGPGGELSSETLLRRLARRSEPSRAAVVLRRTDALAAGGYRFRWLYTINEWNLWLRLAADHSAVFIDDVLAHERIHPDPPEKGVLGLRLARAMLADTIPVLPIETALRRELLRVAMRSNAEAELVAAWDLARLGKRRFAAGRVLGALRVAPGLAWRSPQLVAASAVAVGLPGPLLNRLDRLRARARQFFRH